jgi:DNA-directed RNA polymerase subunit M/transcription elongation factor TFIIS
MDTATDSGVEKVEVAAEVKSEIVFTPIEDNKKEEVIIEKDVDYTQNNLGRLKRTLSEKCPSCSKPMQLRVRQIENLQRGEIITEEDEYKKCSVCDYEEEIKNPKKRKVVFDKTQLKKEDLVIERSPRSGRRDNNDRYPKRNTTPTGTRKDNRKSFRDRK